MFKAQSICNGQAIMWSSGRITKLYISAFFESVEGKAHTLFKPLNNFPVSISTYPAAVSIESIISGVFPGEVVNHKLVIRGSFIEDVMLHPCCDFVSAHSRATMEISRLADYFHSSSDVSPNMRPRSESSSSDGGVVVCRVARKPQPKFDQLRDDLAVDSGDDGIAMIALLEPTPISVLFRAIRKYPGLQEASFMLSELPAATRWTQEALELSAAQIKREMKRQAVTTSEVSFFDSEPADAESHEAAIMRTGQQHRSRAQAMTSGLASRYRYELSGKFRPRSRGVRRR